MPRLNKAIRELNIGFQTAFKFLKSKFGLEVSSLNEMITNEQYESLLTHFNDVKVSHSIMRKKYQTLKSCRKSNPIQVSYTEEEKGMLNNVDDINLTKYIRSTKSKKKKGKFVKARKGAQFNTKRTGRLDNASGFSRIISIPFGGMNKR